MKFLQFSLHTLALCTLFLIANTIPANAENWGTPESLGVSDTNFSEPHDLTITQDGLYLLVADKGNDVVKVLSPGDLKTIGEIGLGEFKSPHDVAIDRQNRLYVADSGNGRIMIYHFEGVSKYTGAQVELIDQWSEGIAGPEGVAIASSKRVYVADTKANALLVIEGGKIVQSIHEAGGVTLSQPHDVEVGADDTVYLSDPGNDRIVIFDKDLNYKRDLSTSDYGFDAPKYIGLDDEGMLFVADQHNDRIVMLDRHMMPVGDIDEGIQVIGGPEGVCVAGRYIWVSDTANDRIVLFRRNRL
ncbi:MAG: hypothetical protein HON65_13385 [Rhodospirillales bacterium]|jgi:tripartite motif-containing protein 71|nr:hypothetical protein [Rhodospirillales bacterium]